MRTTTLAYLVFLGSQSACLIGEDLTVSGPRALMAVCGTLQEKHGMLTTFEDAPTDPITETLSEARPNGMFFRFPKSTPITFHIPAELPIRNDSMDALPAAAAPGAALSALQSLVAEYNQSGNPGRFAVTADGPYLHVQQILRTVNGQLQPFVPVSTQVLAWKPEAKSCESVLTDLQIALQQQHGVGVAIGIAPVGALLTHTCRSTGTSVGVGQVLASILEGLDTSPATGQRNLSYTWHLTFDPNWNKYFLNIYLVSSDGPHTQVSPKTASSSQQAPQTNPGRLGTFDRKPQQ